MSDLTNNRAMKDGRTAGADELKIALLGGFGGGNLGNEASLDAVIKTVRRLAPEVTFVCLCPRPDVVSERFGIPAHTTRSRRPTGRIFSSPVGPILRMPYRLVDIFRALRIIGSFDAILVPGTGILDDYGGEKPTGWPLTLALWFTAARIRGVRTGLVGVGAGPLTNPISRHLAHLTCRLANYRSFRDTASRNFVRSLGLDVPEGEVVPDIAFSRSGGVSTVSRDGRSLVAIPIMRYSGWHRTNSSAAIEARHVDNITEFCTWLLREGYDVRLLTADPNDHETTQRVGQMLMASEPEPSADRLSVAVATDLDDLMRLFSDATVVVATRYHSVIAALMCGKPVISIGYAAKNDELMSEVGLGAYCQHVEMIDRALLRRQFRDLVANHHELSLVIESRVSEFRKRLSEEEERLKACVISGSRRDHRSESPGRRPV